MYIFCIPLKYETNTWNLSLGGFVGGVWFICLYICNPDQKALSRDSAVKASDYKKQLLRKIFLYLFLIFFVTQGIVIGKGFGMKLDDAANDYALLLIFVKSSWYVVWVKIFLMSFKT